MERNLYASVRDDPVTRREAEHLRARLDQLWEDTPVQTAGGVSLGVTGHYKAVLDHLLQDIPLKGEPERLFKRT